MSKKMYGELGKVGTNRWGGQISEEFLPRLQGRKGMEAYREMSENDDMVGASLYAMEMLLRQVSWEIQGASHGEEDEKAREFVETCLHDMEVTWTEFLSEVLSFLTYGWSYHEIVYKRRGGNSKNPKTQSKYQDGLIGWRKLPIRAQDTLWQWAYDDHDQLLGMVQSAPPSYTPTLIPVEKALHFKTKMRKGNPEGRSILRNAYRSWYFKRRIQELEGIGIERDLAGLPFLQSPEGADIWGPGYEVERLEAQQIIKNISDDSVTGVLLPYGWNIELLSTGGKKQFDTDTIIQRYDNRISMCMLTDFMLLGHEAVGSFALSSDKTALFSMALGTFLEVICQVFNSQAIPRLMEVNRGAFPHITDYPKLVHGDLETQNLGELGNFVKEMVSVGAVTLDENLEDYLRRSAHLPPRESGDRKHFTPSGEDLSPNSLEEEELA